MSTIEKISELIHDEINKLNYANYFILADDTVLYPYIVYNPQLLDIIYKFSGEIDIISVDFFIYSTTNPYTILNDLDAIFNRVHYNISGYNFMCCYKKSVSKGERSDDCFTLIATYVFEIEIL